MSFKVVKPNDTSEWCKKAWPIAIANRNHRPVTINKKFSCRWQTVWRLCTPMLRSLTQNATKHSFSCCAVKSSTLVNDCDLLAGFSDFYLPLSLSEGDLLELLLQSGEGRMLIYSVVWAQYTNVKCTQTATSPEQMLCQRTASDGKNRTEVDLSMYTC